MCKEMPAILVNRVVDPPKNNQKKWRAEEEERHKGSLTPQKQVNTPFHKKYYVSLLGQCFD
jgi:hypothetical protein